MANHDVVDVMEYLEQIQIDEMDGNNLAPADYVKQKKKSATNLSPDQLERPPSTVDFSNSNEEDIRYMLRTPGMLGADNPHLLPTADKKLESLPKIIMNDKIPIYMDDAAFQAATKWPEDEKRKQEKKYFTPREIYFIKRRK